MSNAGCNAGVQGAALWQPGFSVQESHDLYAPLLNTLSGRSPGHLNT